MDRLPAVVFYDDSDLFKIIVILDSGKFAECIINWTGQRVLSMPDNSKFKVTHDEYYYSDSVFELIEDHRENSDYVYIKYSYPVTISVVTVTFIEDHDADVIVSLVKNEGGKVKLKLEYTEGETQEIELKNPGDTHELDLANGGKVRFIINHYMNGLKILLLNEHGEENCPVKNIVIGDTLELAGLKNYKET